MIKRIKHLKEDYNNFDKSYKENLLKASTEVIGAYQDANKHLDEVKEFIYTDLSCPFFSSFVHSLAHSMPGRFDKFGDILHTVNMRIPYPTTYQLEKEPMDIGECFEIIFRSLDSIKEKLNTFIEVTDKESHGMAVAAENLLNDIESEYPMLYRLNAKWEQSKDLIEFDKYVMQYVENKDNLLENFVKKSFKRGKSSHKYLITNIRYEVTPEDIDYDPDDFDSEEEYEFACDRAIEKVVSNLPTETIVNVDNEKFEEFEDESELADYLVDAVTDEFGYLIASCEYEEVR